MTFGEKLKKLRHDNDLTQEQFAEKIFVTRTAVSKWETDNGYPSIDSLKEISNLFGVSIDDLISDADVENKKLLDDKIAKRFYYIAIAFWAWTVIFTSLTHFLKQPLFNIGSIIGVTAYIVCGILSKPKYQRLQARKRVVFYIISRLIMIAVIVGLITYTFVAI
ncbi:MAG: helix-turn-helix transcriptional regulator [Clostridiales bacterium]|nr:helix-turn-helix transcriptional regulator [Clostridiales bacterium]